MSSDYNNYVYLQTVKYESHEDSHSVWSDGQIKFLDYIADLLPKNSAVLDVGCGDGISLEKLSNSGHTPVGIDFNENKLEVARNKGCSVYKCDMYDMSLFPDKNFDVVISSHSLEHAYNPIKVLSEINRVLKTDGLLFLVVPFPDTADYAIEAHVGRDILGTSDLANGKMKLIELLNSNKFSVFFTKEDSYREPEVWVFCRKDKDVWL